MEAEHYRREKNGAGEGIRDSKDSQSARKSAIDSGYGEFASNVFLYSSNVEESVRLSLLVS